MTRLTMRWWLACGLVGLCQTAPLSAAGLDQERVLKALLERFDENRNDKLESLEARQARSRLRNLLEDRTDREINIHTWRDDVKPLLQSIDPDEDNRLTTTERDAAAKLLERLIPKVESWETSSKEKSSTSSSSSERKRDSSFTRDRGVGHGAAYGRNTGWNRSGSFYPGAMGGGGWGMGGFGWGGSGGGSSGFSGGSAGFGGGQSGQTGNQFSGQTATNSGFFSGSGAENMNPAKGDLGQTPAGLDATTNPSTSGKESERLKGGRPEGFSGTDPLSDSASTSPPNEFSGDGQPGTKPSDKQDPKQHPGATPTTPRPDDLAGGVETTGGGTKPNGGSSAPTIIPPMPRPAF